LKIKIYHREEIMLLDPSTYESLQIFKHEDHPSALGVGKAKEGLSLYGILNRCVSSIGKNMLRQVPE
jgi:DNA mismatch repair protein MSH5